RFLPLRPPMPIGPVTGRPRLALGPGLNALFAGDGAAASTFATSGFSCFPFGFSLFPFGLSCLPFGAVGLAALAVSFAFAFGAGFCAAFDGAVAVRAMGGGPTFVWKRARSAVVALRRGHRDAALHASGSSGQPDPSGSSGARGWPPFRGVASKRWFR